MYFHGPHRFENGVYVKGIVDHVDLDAEEVSLRVRDYDTDRPITPPELSRRIADVVAPRYRQVFVWPDEWTKAPQCDLKSCKARDCGDCWTWARFPLIANGEATSPLRLRWSEFDDVVPAHWIVPSRCYETRITNEVRELTRRFTEFKWGEMAYAYPFALAIFEQLRRRNHLEFNYVVPIPLSPDKASKGEKHRTRALAKELGRLLAIKMKEMLRLSSSISKRRMLAEGYTVSQFETSYRETLRADVPADARRILLIDDVMTRGSTAAQALKSIRERQPGAVIVVATAGQMIVKEAVVDGRGFKAT